MIERVEERLELKPNHLAGDVAYGTGEMLAWLVNHDIDPHIPVWDKSKRAEGTFSRADFACDNEGDLYICPGGKTLYYPPSKRDCEACACVASAAPRTSSR